jgi:NDP-sugar pyrophosphorylase family protein
VDAGDVDTGPITFLGRPLVVHVLAALTRLAIREAAVNLHYRPESVRAALADLPDGSTQVRYAH